jgi:release factor glutamine methyltransferase
MLEHGYDQADLVAEIFKKNGYTGVESRKDLLGHERVTLGCWKE